MATHPSGQTGNKRICPVTGKVFKWSWSKKAVFDVCDQCDNGELPPATLHKLDQQRKQTPKEQE